jgi:hypothetical protein
VVKAWRGKARSGKASPGLAVEASQGNARPGEAWNGEAGVPGIESGLRGFSVRISRHAALQAILLRVVALHMRGRLAARATDGARRLVAAALLPPAVVAIGAHDLTGPLERACPMRGFDALTLMTSPPTATATPLRAKSGCMSENILAARLRASLSRRARLFWFVSFIPIRLCTPCDRRERSADSPPCWARRASTSPPQ